MTHPPVTAHLVVDWLSRAADDLHRNVGLLTELDAARGDADHGVNMDRGFRSISDAFSDNLPTSGRQALLTAASVIRKGMGGTSGALWATALRRAGKEMAETDPSTGQQLVRAVAALGTAMQELGGAAEGQNTILDALLPAARSFESHLAEGDDLTAAAWAAAEAAGAGARSTAGRIATLGRASYLGERGMSAQDPGATSAAIVVAALASSLASALATAEAPAE